VKSVYFDNNATTPLDSRVRDRMLPWLGDRHGNPSSVHRFGQQARDAVEVARSNVAALLAARPVEIVFTASGTEANNAILWSVVRRAGFEGHVIVSALEHPSIVETAAQLSELGVEVTRLPPSPAGVVEVEAVEAALRPDTRMVCVMSASNEIGTLQPVEAIAALCRERGVWMHCDAVQSAGKVAVDVGALDVDSLVIGAHKFHGPLGAAALWIRQDAEFSAGLVGGSQERGRRAGTENVAAIVGFGEACRLGRLELGERYSFLRGLRDRFEDGLTDIPDVKIHCRDSPRLPHTSHLAILGVEGEALLIRLDLAGYAVSTGSACASGVVEPSPALTAMGLEAEEALASLRVSFGMTNTMEQVDDFVGVFAREADVLRQLAPAMQP
jgi:cysteine desulfurase